MAAKISRGDTRIYAQRFVIQGVRAGLSGNAILQQLRDVGLGYRTQNFYEDYSRYLGSSKLPRLSSVARLPKDYSLQYKIRVPTTGGSRYQYTFSVTGTNRDTGEEQDITFSFVSPYPLLDDVIKARLDAMPLDSQYNLDFNPEDVSAMPVYEFFSEVP